MIWPINPQFHYTTYKNKQLAIISVQFSSLFSFGSDISWKKELWSSVNLSYELPWF